MTIKADSHGTVFTGAHIEFFKLVCLKQSLALRLVGIRTPGLSPIMVCKRDYGLKGNARKLLPQVQKLIEKFKVEHPNPNSETGK
jgi:hypothetical protein